MARLIISTYSFAIVTVVLVVVSTVVFELPVRMLLADPVTVGKPRWYAGFLSNLTVLTWGVGGLAALWASYLHRVAGANNEWERFFRYAGIFTLILMLDDLYMFHEEIFPNYLFAPKITGIEPSEKFIVGGYALFMLWFFYRFRDLVKKSPKLHLGVALGLMALSIVLDRGVGPKIVPNKMVRIFMEDCGKYLGAVAWSLYFVLTARQEILPLIGKLTDRKVKEA